MEHESYTGSNHCHAAARANVLHHLPRGQWSQRLRGLRGRRWGHCQAPFCAAACDIMRVLVCVRTSFNNCATYGVVKAFCACSLMRWLGPFVRTSAAGVWSDTAVWKERPKVTSVYAKEVCTLIKLISNLLSVRTVAAMMALECAQVCSSCWWSTLMSTRKHVYLFISIRSPTRANNRHTNAQASIIFMETTLDGEHIFDVSVLSLSLSDCPPLFMSWPRPGSSWQCPSCFQMFLLLEDR